MWHIRWGLDARDPDVLLYPKAARRGEKQANTSSCTYFGSAGPGLSQEQMKSQKQAQNQGLQLGTGQGQVHRVGDLVVSVEKGRDQLWGMGVSRVDGPSDLCWTMAPWPPREVWEAR